MDNDRKSEQSQEQQPSQDEQYLKLLKGEITSTEFVKGLKDQVRQRTRSTHSSKARGRAAGA